MDPARNISVPSNAQLLANAQQVGAQTTGVQKKDLEAGQQMELPFTEQDQVTLTAQGQKDGAQTGKLQGDGKKTTGADKKEGADEAQQTGEKKDADGITAAPGGGGGADDDEMPSLDGVQAPPPGGGGPAGPKQVDLPSFMKKGGTLPPGYTGTRTQQAGNQVPPGCGGGGPNGPGPVAPPGCGGGGPNGPGPVAPPSQGSVPQDSAAANLAMVSQQDALQANQIYWQMYAERQKAMWKIFQLLQDLQTDIYKTISETAANRAKVMDGIASKWAQVLGA